MRLRDESHSASTPTATLAPAPRFRPRRRPPQRPSQAAHGPLRRSGHALGSCAPRLRALERRFCVALRRAPRAHLHTQSGKIFQRFSEPDADGKGRLDNIVLFSLPLLEERQGVRLTVNIE